MEALAKGKRETVRNEVLADLLTNENTPGLMKVDAINDKQLFKPERVKVEGADGKETYFDAVPNLSGGFDYTPAKDSSNQPLKIAPSSSETSLAKNIQLMKNYGYSGGEALQILTSTRRKTSSQLWEEFVKQASSSPSTGYGANKGKVQTVATELFQIARPGEEIPSMVDEVNRGSGAPDQASQATDILTSTRREPPGNQNRQRGDLLPRQ